MVLIKENRDYVPYNPQPLELITRSTKKGFRRQKYTWYLAVGECMHSQIWNNSGSNGSINVIFCEWIEQILNNYFMKFYQICV